MVVDILLIILAVLVIAGMVRAITNKSEGVWDFISDMLWFDFLGDVLESIITSLFEDWD